MFIPHPLMYQHHNFHIIFIVEDVDILKFLQRFDEIDEISPKIVKFRCIIRSRRLLIIFAIVINHQRDQQLKILVLPFGKAILRPVQKFKQSRPQLHFPTVITNRPSTTFALFLTRLSINRISLQQSFQLRRRHGRAAVDRLKNVLELQPKFLIFLRTRPGLNESWNRTGRKRRLFGRYLSCRDRRNEFKIGHVALLRRLNLTHSHLKFGVLLFVEQQPARLNFEFYFSYVQPGCAT